ncbi:MAG: sugar phosphate nucleotidyltransferase [Clostridiales bacterium]|nr:sugar phosphate nucleotidyltransferase [Clostridiales bacterium]
MNIILLSGGSGKRLWPLSNDIRSKQFIKMFKNNEGEYESMVQRVYRQIKSVDPDANITIATSKKQVSTINNQLGGRVAVCVEPARRDTFPAIALAAAFLKSEKGVSEDEAVLVCPVDPYVEDSYFEALKELFELAQKGCYRLNLMGVEPTYPSEKYGYIIPEETTHVSKVEEFKEKPSKEAAEQYIGQGALWNCGVFAFKLGYLLEIAHRHINFDSYLDIYSSYEALEKISFDYAVVEHESSIGCLRYSGEWKDIGSWNTFAEEMSETAIGKATLNEACKNTNVINELNIPILCMGCKDMIIAASGDGILVSDKEQSSYIKPYAEVMDTQAMYAEKSWGSYTVLDVNDSSMVIKVVLMPGHRMYYHSHEHRDEVWTIVSGTGTAVIDGEERSVKPGDVITMGAGCRHTIIADSELNVIEVQMGEDISVEDKIKYEL